MISDWATFQLPNVNNQLHPWLSGRLVGAKHKWMTVWTWRIWSQWLLSVPLWRPWFWHWMILRRRWWIVWQRSSAPRRNARKVSLRWHWSFWSRICRPCHTTLPMRVWPRPWSCSSRKSSSMNVSVNKPPSGQDTGQIVSPPFFFGYPPTGRRTWTEGSGFLPATASSEGGTWVLFNVLIIS